MAFKKALNFFFVSSSTVKFRLFCRLNLRKNAIPYRIIAKQLQIWNHLALALWYLFQEANYML